MQRLTFLDILLDTVAMSMELQEKKFIELKELLQKANMPKKLTKQQLQSLAGKLNWASQCVQGNTSQCYIIICLMSHRATCMANHVQWTTMYVKSNMK